MSDVSDGVVGWTNEFAATEGKSQESGQETFPFFFHQLYINNKQNIKSKI